jgi:hypothetical protein
VFEGMKFYSKNPPASDLFLLIQMANSILQQVQRHFEQAVLPTVSSSVKVRLDCLRARDDLFIPLENKVIKALELMMKGKNISIHSSHEKLFWIT